MAWRDLYPFKSRYLTLLPVPHVFRSANGDRLHYVDEGAGETLLFVHGNPTWSFYWRNLILGLRDQYRCVALDHIGCGLSDKPQNYSYHLPGRISDLVEFVEELQLRGITLVAHDWGGPIALGAMTLMREWISRVVVFNTGAFPPPFVPWRIAACRVPALGTFAVRGLNAFAQAATAMAVEKHERMSPDVRDGLLAPYDSWTNRVAINEFVRDIPFTPQHPTWQVLEDLEGWLPDLGKVPTMLIWGMKDWCFRPSCLARFQQHWPNAEVHKFEDCGHYVVEDAHERIVPLMRDFLARHPLRSPQAAAQ
jgi:haloalkane dehalogenase